MTGRNIFIAPSILSADFGNLASELNALEKSGVDMVHIDVMDGHFVPNLTIGPPVIKMLRPHSSLPFDVHLMIETPQKWLEAYRDAGADRITFHLEACRHSQRYLSCIREMNLFSGISLNPQTPLDGLEYILDVCDQVLIMTVNPGFGGQKTIEPVIEKIDRLRKMIDSMGLKTLIEVDGGISEKNAQRIVDAGADILVMGSAYYSQKNRPSFVKKLKSRLTA